MIGNCVERERKRSNCVRMGFLYEKCNNLGRHNLWRPFSSPPKLYIPSTLNTDLAAIMDCGCSKMLNNGLNDGFLGAKYFFSPLVPLKREKNILALLS